MKYLDYCQHLATFRRDRKVVFSKREDTIDFVATYISKVYEDYLKYVPVLANGPRDQRVDSEPALVKMYANGFLEENVPYDGLLVMACKKFGWHRYEVRIGTNSPDDTLYKLLMKQIAQGDAVDEVFDTDHVIVVRNDNEVDWETV